MASKLTGGLPDVDDDEHNSETSHLLTPVNTTAARVHGHHNDGSTTRRAFDEVDAFMPRLSEDIIKSSFPSFSRYTERRETGETTFLSTYGSTGSNIMANDGANAERSSPSSAFQATTGTSGIPTGVDTTDVTISTAGLKTPQPAGGKWRLDDFNSNTPLNDTSGSTGPQESSNGPPPTVPRAPLTNRIVPLTASRPSQQTAATDATMEPIPVTTYGGDLYSSSNNTSNSRRINIIRAWIGLIVVAIFSFAISALWRTVNLQGKQITALMNRMDTIDSNFREFKHDTEEKLAKLTWDLNFISNQEKQFESSTQTSFDQTKKQITLLQANDSATSQKVTTLASEITQHDAIITRLNNRTSNAEVLDQLKLTKQHVSLQLASTKEDIAGSLDATRRNVSDQLIRSHNELNHTIHYMRSLVSSAAEEIYAVQEDVTGQLSQMEDHLQTTVSDLNAAVDLAKETISQEVSEVKSDIDMYVAATNKEFAVQNDFVKYQLAGTFTLLGCLISLWHMTSHLRHYYKPDVQRRVMAVLWMVPIYGITSWLSLVAPSFEAIFGAVRDCYEAYAVYTFIGLLIAILEDGKGLPELIKGLAHHVTEERHAITLATAAVAAGNKIAIPAEHLKPPFPCCYNNDNVHSVASVWLHQCLLMAMQFVLLKPLLTVVPLIVSLIGYDYNVSMILDDHSINWYSPKLYANIVQNISVAIAFYGLLSFYHGTEKDLAWCDPWPKFLCIKGVVFMTFWQGACLQAMSSTGMVDSHTATQFQNLLICIEMLLASIAHFYIFPYQEWREGYKKDKMEKSVLKDTLAFHDFVRDMRRVVTRWDDVPQQPLLDLDMHKSVDGSSSATVDSGGRAQPPSAVTSMTPELLAMAAVMSAQLDHLEAGEPHLSPGTPTDSGPELEESQSADRHFTNQVTSFMGSVWSPFLGGSNAPTSGQGRHSLPANFGYSAIGEGGNRSTVSDSSQQAASSLPTAVSGIQGYQLLAAMALDADEEKDSYEPATAKAEAGKVHDDESDDEHEAESPQENRYFRSRADGYREGDDDDDDDNDDSSGGGDEVVSNSSEEDSDDDYGRDEDRAARAPFKHIGSPEVLLHQQPQESSLDDLDRQLAEERDYVEASMRQSFSVVHRVAERDDD